MSRVMSLTTLIVPLLINIIVRFLRHRLRQLVGLNSISGDLRDLPNKIIKAL